VRIAESTEGTTTTCWPAPLPNLMALFLESEWLSDYSYDDIGIDRCIDIRRSPA